MQTQEMTVLGALFSFLAGIILFAAGTLEEAIRRLRFPEGASIPNAASSGEGETHDINPETVTCQFCDARVAAPNRPCSSVSEESIRLNADRITKPSCREELASRGLL